MFYTVTANTDLTTKGKRLYSWSFSNTVAAGVINLRDGGVAGPIVVQIQLAIGASQAMAYDGTRGLLFPNGPFVQVVSGTVVGSVDVD